MTLAGTRPPTVDEWEKYELHHRARLATKPGLTGMWQVSGRSNITDFEEVVELDREYMQYMKKWTGRTRTSPFHICHFRIAVAKNEIHAVAVLIKDKFYHAECQRHIVQ